MTSIRCSLAVFAVLTVAATPALAECDAVVFPQTHLNKDMSRDELDAMGKTLGSTNADLMKYRSCIDKLEATKPSKNASKEDIAQHQAEIDKHERSFTVAHENLARAASEYNVIAAAYNKAHGLSKDAQ
jgi:hypothetical protein